MHDGPPTGQLDFTAPRKAEDLGIPVAMVHDIVLRQTLADGRTSTLQLSNKLRLSPILMTTVVEELRDLRYLEVQGVDGRDYLLAPTEAGRMQALDRMTLCRYTGPAPVSLEAYTRVIKAQHATPSINLPALKAAFSDLVISDELLKEIGPAAIAGGAMFMYGPPGTGKSSIAERLLRVYGDQVMVPHAVEVDGQIITVFDPVVHRPAKEQPKDLDGRWLLCDRPFIIVGGELQGSMLDLAYQSNSGVYLAPVQMQANNGVLVIDDFGRQSALTPQELLNRWIVPLDRQIDYLSLDYGMKFQVPFDAKIVFSTNLEPSTLGDEAFFRRIQSKILIPTIKDDQFDEVLRRVAKAMDVELTPDAATHLRWMSRELGDGDLRPYLPAAVCRILISICMFEGVAQRLDPTMIERIAHLYFTHAPERYAEDEAAKSKRFAAEAVAASQRPKTSIFGGAKPTAVVAEGIANDRNWTSVAAKAVAALKAESQGDAPAAPEVIEPSPPPTPAPIEPPAADAPAYTHLPEGPTTSGADTQLAAPSWTFATPSESAPANP